MNRKNLRMKKVSASFQNQTHGQKEGELARSTIMRRCDKQLNQRILDECSSNMNAKH